MSFPMLCSQGCKSQVPNSSTCINCVSSLQEPLGVSSLAHLGRKCCWCGRREINTWRCPAVPSSSSSDLQSLVCQIAAIVWRIFGSFLCLAADGKFILLMAGNSSVLWSWRKLGKCSGCQSIKLFNLFMKRDKTMSRI